MKKYFILFIVLGFLSISAFAQSFTTIPNDTVVATLANSTMGQYIIMQINNTGGTLSLDIEVVENTIPAGWDGMVCLQGICLGFIPPVGYTASQEDLNANDTGYVRLTADPMTAGGGGVLRIYVFDVNFPLDGDTLTWIINPDPTSVGEVNNLFKAKLSPNPVNEVVSILSESRIEKIEIYSLRGKLIYSKTSVNSNEFKINVEEYISGIYMVKLTDENNKLHIQKLNIQ